MPPVWLLRWLSQLNVLLYRLSGGKLWSRMNGLPVILLTTTGRHSGRPHTTPTVYVSDGERLIIAPGFVETPDWYLNLKASPQASILRGRTHQTVTAKEVDPAERERLWPLVPGYWKQYRIKYNNELPLIILAPQP